MEEKINHINDCINKLKLEQSSLQNELDILRKQKVAILYDEIQEMFYNHFKNKTLQEIKNEIAYWNNTGDCEENGIHVKLTELFKTKLDTWYTRDIIVYYSFIDPKPRTFMQKWWHGYTEQDEKNRHNYTFMITLYDDLHKIDHVFTFYIEKSKPITIDTSV